MALLQGCASFWPQTAKLAEGLPAGIPEKVELTEVPFYPQKEYQCGPAALATALVASGVKVTPEVAVVLPSGEIAYRGRIDDRVVDFGVTRPEPTKHDLEEALERALSGQRAAPAEAPAIGCSITSR